MNVSLTPTLEEFTRSKVESGLYNNASEVLREALRLMIERDRSQEILRRELALGFQQLEAGQGIQVSSEAEFLNLVRPTK